MWALVAGSRVAAAAARDAPALSPEALPGRAAKPPGARRRRPQDKRPAAKSPPGEGTACRKYFSSDSPHPHGGAPRRAEPWQPDHSRLREGKPEGRACGAGVGEIDDIPRKR